MINEKQYTQEELNSAIVKAIADMNKVLDSVRNMPKQPNPTVTETIEQVKEEICDCYCKYRGKYSDFDALVEDKCSTCPLNKL